MSTAILLFSMCAKMQSFANIIMLHCGKNPFILDVDKAKIMLLNFIW